MPSALRENVHGWPHGRRQLRTGAAAPIGGVDLIGTVRSADGRVARPTGGVCHAV